MKPMESTTQCPYCSKETPIDLPGDYAPVYARCILCEKKFIVERLAKGFQAFTRENAPCCSDPDCRALEMGSCDEQ